MALSKRSARKWRTPAASSPPGAWRHSCAPTPKRWKKSYLISPWRVCDSSIKETGEIVAIDSFTAPPSDSSRGNTSDKVGSQIRRRTIVLSALGGLAALAGGYFSTLHPAVPSEIPAGDANERRILSLSPGVTDTIFSLNAGNELIAVSDYCRLPNDDRKLPQVGTAL